MTKKQIMRTFEQRDAELLDRLIGRFNQLLLWQMTWGVLGVVDEKQAKELEARFKKIREKALRQAQAKEFPRTPINEEYELDKNFFRELQALLNEFIIREGLGTEYDKRRAKHFVETAIAYEKIARE